MKYVVGFEEKTGTFTTSEEVVNFFCEEWMNNGNSLQDSVNLAKAIVVVLHHEGSVRGNGFWAELQAGE